MGCSLGLKFEFEVFVNLNPNSNAKLKLLKPLSCKLPFIQLISDLHHLYQDVRIAVNTRFLQKGKLEGFGWYTYETLSRITKQHPEHEFIFLFDRPFDPSYVFADNVTAIQVGLPARRGFLFYLWFEKAITKALKKHKADVFVSPDGYLSTKTDCKQLAVIHDLNFEHHPDDLPSWASKYLRKWFPRFAKKADRIVTVSHYSKQDIVNCYQIDPDKIDVVWNGAADLFTQSNEESRKTARDQFCKGNNYFIYIGALNPRKNIGRLLQAFDAYKKRGGSNQLLIVGEKMFSNGPMETIYQSMEHQTDVIFTGRLNSEDLNLALGGAMALCYVSYFEGFGIPIAEAFRTGTPVITSNATSLPEVAGDAAIIVDPLSVNDISDALSKMEESMELQSDLREKGLARASLFDWQKSADGLWASIEKLLEHN